MASANHNPAERPRILILEDQSSTDEVLDRELQRLPFHFKVRRTGTRAGLVNELRRFTPDVILYNDWHRGMSELEALGLTRRHSPDVPFIIIDGALDEHTAHRCKEAGATDIITQGTLIRLGPAISGALRHPRSSAPGPTGPAWEEDTEVLRLIAGTVSDLIAVLDTDGRRIYNSPSYAALFGDPDTLQGTDSFAEIHPDDREHVRQVFQRTLTTGIGERTEYRFLLATGEIRNIESQGNAVRDASGAVSRIVVVSRDITPRREAEEALRRSEIRFRSLIENSSDAIALVNGEGVIEYTSPSTTRVLGYETGELIGVNALHLVHPDDRERASTLLHDITDAPGRSVCIQYRFLHRNGPWRWIEASWKNMLHDMHVHAVIVNYRDITEGRQALEDLRKSDERHRAFVGQSSEGIWRVELDEPMTDTADEGEQIGHILRHAYVAQCNDTMAKVYGFQHAVEMHGKPLRELLQASGGNSREQIRTFIRSGYRILNAESTWVDGAGTNRYSTHNIMGIVENGRLVRAWGTHRDITEQKEAEGKVTILAHAWRSISEGVYLTDLEERLVFVNPALLSIYGYTDNDLLGNHVRILRGTRSPGTRDEEMPAPTSSGTWTGELTHCRKDGSSLRVSLSTSVVRSESGEVIALMGVIHDITDSKRAELLQDAVYRIAQAADAAPSLNDLYPAVHAIIQEVMPANNFYIALHDDREDLLYFPYFVDEVDVPLPPMKPGKGLTAHVLRTGTSLLCTELVWDELVRRGDVELVGIPSPIWLGVPLSVASRTIGVMVVQHYSDAAAYGPIEQHMLEFVSSQVAKAIERKRSEEALRESEERFRQMFEDDLTGDFISTPEGKILACNPAFARIFGFASVEEALRSDCRVLHVDTEARGTVFDLVRQHRKLDYHEMELRRKDERPLFVVANLIGTFDEQDTLVSVKGYLFDNTERKRLEDQLLHAQKMEAVGQLASGIAHDFNNVMSVTLTSAQMICASTTDESTKRYANIIEDTTLRGAAIAKQLLQFSRAEASKLSPISLGHVVSEVKKILDHSLPKTIVIRLAINLKQGVIMGDEGQIHQLLLNLCINARDAMTSTGEKEGTGTLSIVLESTPGSEVTRKFGGRETGDHAVLRVSDTGAGIPPEVRRRMFEPFFTTKGIGKGTGLGLSIVHGIVKSHRGYIDVESTPGQGATFSVYFPIVAHEIAISAQSTDCPSLGRGETILVIEDEEILRMLLTEMLTRAGYRVREARDGEEGVAIFRAEHLSIAAVISDMGLPLLSGEQVFHALRSVDRDVRLIFSTGYIQDEKRQELLDAGAKRFIHKPYRVDEMLVGLRQVLDSPE
jgi:two-component system, cell cycle sensor histidine kinase and response regulator CckA